MPSLNYGVSLSGGGVSIARTLARTADGLSSREVTLPAGKPGTLTTRTDDNTGVATLSTGHGITTGMICDIYWAAGMRYGMTATVATNAVTLDGGAGDNLPSTSTAVVVVHQVQINADVDGDNLSILGIELGFANPNDTSVGHVDFQDTENDSILPLDLVANTPQIFDIAGGATNVFTGDPITKLLASNGSSANDATLRLLVLEDSTP